MSGIYVEIDGLSKERQKEAHVEYLEFCGVTEEECSLDCFISEARSQRWEFKK